MTRVIEHCDDRWPWSIVMKVVMEHCDDKGMELCDDKGHGAL